MLKVGQKAPEFKLEDQHHLIHHLKSYLGKKVVLYFYPKDQTPGCTKQACLFKEVYQEFAKYDAIVIGISKDSVKSHLKFAEKYELPFTLLSDESGEVSKAYGVIGEKTMFGKIYKGIRRTTYLINEEGIITDVFEKVDPKQNAFELLDVLKKKNEM